MGIVKGYYESAFHFLIVIRINKRANIVSSNCFREKANNLIGLHYSKGISQVKKDIDTKINIYMYVHGRTQNIQYIKTDPSKLINQTTPKK